MMWQGPIIIVSNFLSSILVINLIDYEIIYMNSILVEGCHSGWGPYLEGAGRSPYKHIEVMMLIKKTQRQRIFG